MNVQIDDYSTNDRAGSPLEQRWSLRWIAVACVVAAAIAVTIGGCTDDTSLDDVNASSNDGDVSADADDVEDVEDDSDAGDSTGDDGGSDAGDSNDGGENNDDETLDNAPDWRDCDCADPDDKCSRSKCGRPGIECGEGEECPDGYTCHDNDIDAPHCVCDGERDDCGPFCESSADCPALGDVCDRDDGVCRPKTSCQYDIHCPRGTICGFMRGLENICYEFGDLEQGEYCESDFDCATGLCVEDACRDQCLGDGDCDDGKHCTDFLPNAPGNSIDGCRNTDELYTSCVISCDDDERCSGSVCNPQWCLHSGDCEDADCVPQGAHFPAECEQLSGDEDYACKPDEVRSQSEDYCSLREPCWDDEDCGDDYECGDNGTCLRYMGDE